MVSTIRVDHAAHAEDDGCSSLKTSIKTSTANSIDMAMSVEEADAVLAKFGYVDAQVALV